MVLKNARVDNFFILSKKFWDKIDFRMFKTGNKATVLISWSEILELISFVLVYAAVSIIYLKLVLFWFCWLLFLN